MDAHVLERAGLIWGFDFEDGAARPAPGMSAPEPGARHFRWLHVDLNDQRSHRWIADCEHLPDCARELLLGQDLHPHSVADGHVLACVLPDVVREFDHDDPRLGVLRLVAAPGLMVTARQHPIKSTELAHDKIQSGAAPADPGRALELMLASMIETARQITIEINDRVQAIEDLVLTNGRTPDAGAFVTLRALMVRMHRLLGGGASALREVIDMGGAPQSFTAVLDRAARRLSALDDDILHAQSQLLLLREEIDLQATQRTDRNLYVLSIVTILTMPPMLIMAFFGMNTGGLPWTMHPLGALLATGLAMAFSAVVYVGLRGAGFIGGKGRPGANSRLG